MRKFVPSLVLAPFLVLAQEKQVPDSAENSLLTGTRQLTYEGRRAGEGYFSADGSKMVFQSEREAGNPFFQIYVLDLETGDTQRVSPGTGKTTCAWFHPGGERLLFASTHDDDRARAKQDEELKMRKEGRERRYAWDYDEHFDIYTCDLGGGDLRNLTRTRGYDAEGSFSPDGNWIAFASNRHAYTEELSKEDVKRFEIDKSFLMDIYIMRADGGDVRRLTKAKGYDGGPFFSPDGKRICWRRFNEKGDLAEIRTMKTDGTDQKQITRLGAMSWAPFYHPSNEYLVFATNKHGFDNFELYVVDVDGEKDPVRVTTTQGFDGLPVFSPDGTRLSWTSNRTSTRQSQIHLAQWNHQSARQRLGLENNQGPTQAVPVSRSTSSEIAIDDLRQHIQMLASEKHQGRLTGTSGEQLATDYVAQWFRRIGLEPAGTKGEYFQPFDFTAGVNLGEGNTLKIHKSDRPDTITAPVEQWTPLSFSTTGEVKPGKIAFAGYGIEIPEETDGDGNKTEAYSSYAHLDVEGKWVMVFRYMPENITPEERQRFARYSSLRYKALMARQRGAAGMIVVSGPNSKARKQLVPLGFDASLAGSGIAAVSVTDTWAESLLQSGGVPKSLKDLQDALDTGEIRGGILLRNVSVSADIRIQEEKRTGRNVLGILKASLQTDEPPVLVGAHVDHLGATAGSNSRARDGEDNQIHFGADDNASGTAGLIEMAEYLAHRVSSGKLKPNRDIIFAAWSGEELGLLGSAHYVREIARAQGNADAKLTNRFSACLNMDMIGRMGKNLILQGIGSSPAWPRYIERCNVPVGLPLALQQDCYIATDATSFYLRGVPILNAFTGAHEDYHTPRDTEDKIRYEGCRDITRFMAQVARALVTTDEEPVYQETNRPEDRGGRAQLRVYLGTIPDYAQGDVEGVKLSGVRAGGPAAKAGVQAGDIIVKLAGKDIKNIYDYTYVIGAMKVGEECEIVVRRKEERVPLKIVPGSRD